MQNYIDSCLLWSNRATAQFKRAPADFTVHEILDWEFKGQGEHVFLYVEKTDCNTVWVAKQLAKFYNVPPRDVGFSGLKDRHAVTQQYFSIRLPGVKAGAYDVPEHDEYRVVSHTLHDKKLKRGNHQFNDFCITLYDVSGERTLIEQRLAYIREHGCPNLFDSQRFGKRNLVELQEWIQGARDVRKRTEKSVLLSSLRSAYFNYQLGKHVAAHTWQTVQQGSIAMLDGSRSYFVVDQVDDVIAQRARSRDIHPAGVLIGAKDVTEDWQGSDALDNAKLRQILQRERLETGYRSLRLVVRDLQWRFPDKSVCEIKMRLPAGAYASGVIRQVFDIGDT